MAYKDIIIWPGLIILSCLLISGCSTNRVAVDLTNYVNQDVLRISEMETESLKRYAEVTGANYVSDDMLIKVLKEDVIPIYRRFLELLKEIRPQTGEIKELHRISVNGAEWLYWGFIEMLGGLELRDEDMISAANKKIEKGRIENDRWRKELLTLYKKYRIDERPR